MPPPQVCHERPFRREDDKETDVKGILLWLIGIPIPIIILLYLFVFR